MRTVRRLLYRDIASSVVFVALAFLSLFYFIDFVDELEAVGRNGYTIGHALLVGVLELPGPRPPVRRMVYSDDCAMRAREKMVPISTAIGNSS